MGMTPSREGNGCANGKHSYANARLCGFLYFPACGFHSVIQADVHGEGAVRTSLWPGATTLHNSKGCLLHRGALESRPLGRSPRTAAWQQPRRKSTLNQRIIRGLEKSALVRFLVCTFYMTWLYAHAYPLARMLWAVDCDDLQGTPAKGLPRTPHNTALLSPFFPLESSYVNRGFIGKKQSEVCVVLLWTLLSHCHCYCIRKCQLGTSSVAVSELLSRGLPYIDS